MVTVTIYQARKYDSSTDRLILIGWGTENWIKDRRAEPVAGSARDVPLNQLDSFGKWIDPEGAV